MESRIMNYESGLSQMQDQSLIRLSECKAAVKQAVKLYLEYCERVLKRFNAAIANSSYSADSFSVSQVAVAGRV